ncbi:hypothetical protein C8R44DRAFT_729354 [Mycena epipterygia]|nr:hypothetical protein C8R44DRAFT_729354 [Mycena epipterygia]
MSDRLPTELWLEVFHNLPQRYPKGRLKRLSLACRTFHRTARHLFADFDFHPYTSVGLGYDHLRLPSPEKIDSTLERLNFWCSDEIATLVRSCENDPWQRGTSFHSDSPCILLDEFFERLPCFTGLQRIHATQAHFTQAGLINLCRRYCYVVGQERILTHGLELRVSTFSITHLDDEDDESWLWGGHWSELLSPYHLRQLELYPCKAFFGKIGDQEPTDGLFRPIDGIPSFPHGTGSVAVCKLHTFTCPRGTRRSLPDTAYIPPPGHPHPSHHILLTLNLKATSLFKGLAALPPTLEHLAISWRFGFLFRWHKSRLDGTEVEDTAEGPCDYRVAQKQDTSLGWVPKLRKCFREASRSIRMNILPRNGPSVFHDDILRRMGLPDSTIDATRWIHHNGHVSTDVSRCYGGAVMAELIFIVLVRRPLGQKMTMTLTMVSSTTASCPTIPPPRYAVSVLFEKLPMSWIPTCGLTTSRSYTIITGSNASFPEVRTGMKFIPEQRKRPSSTLACLLFHDGRHESFTKQRPKTTLGIFHDGHLACQGSGSKMIHTVQNQNQPGGSDKGVPRPNRDARTHVVAELNEIQLGFFSNRSRRERGRRDSKPKRMTSLKMPLAPQRMYSVTRMFNSGSVGDKASLCSQRGDYAEARTRWTEDRALFNSSMPRGEKSVSKVRGCHFYRNLTGLPRYRTFSVRSQFGFVGVVRHQGPQKRKRSGLIGRELRNLTWTFTNMRSLSRLTNGGLMESTTESQDTWTNYYSGTTQAAQALVQETEQLSPQESGRFPRRSYWPLSLIYYSGFNRNVRYLPTGFGVPPWVPALR